MNDPFILGKKILLTMNHTNPSQARKSVTSNSVRCLTKACALGIVAFGIMPVTQATVTDVATGASPFVSAPAVNTGVLDITNNDVIYRSGNYALLNAYTATGYNIATGYWDGPGIRSSTAALDLSGLTAVGVTNNVNVGYLSWPRIASVNANGGNLIDNPAADARPLPTGVETMFKYTWLGDADLNGVVDDANDYGLFLAGLNDLTGATTGWGWGVGDFDYSGGKPDDAGDYILFVLGLNGQTGPLVGQGVSTGAALPVPEPSAIGMLLFGVFGLMSWRCRKQVQA